MDQSKTIAAKLVASLCSSSGVEFPLDAIRHSWNKQTQEWVQVPRNYPQRQRTLPRAMVLVYQPELTHSVWQDWLSQHRTQRGMEKRLQQGVRDGEWVAWRLIHIEKEVMGNV